ncbi:oxygenase MpaB family protein [Auraticoccus monumenti]|uniref:ER-bound oxygenase mpaB/mpaB'/Rubber oxygenase catalytic domain-containing protein n=1 Tax=Auraticoccus monumenti TaxID=675864 RepID=A0A1G6SYZ7_9ACTN|nr:oxygenase MpaB family protein [Auraticoccus monumenti]SDD21983.1 hypothetical protein SAMN04489747_0471 [Auraticoccus monumenti]
MAEEPTAGDDGALLAWALATGDPLADDLVAEQAALGPGARRWLEQGLRAGVASLSADPPAPGSVPPALGSFLAEAEAVVDAAGARLLAEGPLPTFTTPTEVHVISLSAGALVRVYSSPSIAGVLVGTGDLVADAHRRIVETGRWLGTATLPGSLRRGAPGYVATLQVRLLHARVRASLRRDPLRHQDGPAPLNQLELARTWLDFTLTVMTAEAQLGFDLDPAEQASLYRYWRCLGRLLGVDHRLLADVTDHDSARRLDALVARGTEAPAAASATLTAASLTAVAAELRRTTRLPRWVGSPVLAAVVRRVHGHRLADGLGVPRAPLAAALLTPVVTVLRRHRRWRRRRPGSWAAAVRANLARTRSFLDAETSTTAYQHPR